MQLPLLDAFTGAALATHWAGEAGRMLGTRGTSER